MTESFDQVLTENAPVKFEAESLENSCGHIRKLACKELVTDTCNGLGWVGWVGRVGWLVWLGLAWLGFVVGSSTLPLTATIFIYSRA